MAEYIEREAIEYPYMTMSMWGLNSDTCKAYNEGIKAVADYIANLPNADVVEVVRCGQCRHATDDIIVEGVCYCHKIQQGMFLDGFCSYGEGRTDK